MARKAVERRPPPLVRTHPLAAVAAEIHDALRKVTDPVKAQRFMVSGHDVFGGMSPVQMIQAGRVDEVRRAVADMKSETQR